ncbi:GUN4 domain-containing protein [Nostoc sp. FACHB-145]|uniref:GUN4 domain-containing protein n=1 Tax=Nostoc sp. FACHB-145 TaxID=2692836 RepID=UPI001F549C15|nr:GUN4 domain-containing protein [Nostoc sp. FACHB-145]
MSQGGTLAQAIASTYQKSIEQKVPDWHKLRLYIANTLPGALVTPLRTPKRKQLPNPSNEVEFRDDEKRLRVATRKNFVGRRRQLQNCLRILRTDFDKVGVLIHGMGGWGKSSIASRLWDRLPEHEKILWWRQFDESYLIKKLLLKLIKPELQEIRSFLAISDESLDVKLTYLFSQLAEREEKPFLLILDDFEWNLEPREGQYILKAEVAPILSALVQAIQETGTNNRIIITCRYDFNSDLLEFFYKQGLKPLRDAELTKKLSRLKHFSSNKISGKWLKRALNLADGNPRLLEFLDELLGYANAKTKLTELEQSPELWTDKIIWDDLYQLIDKSLQTILSYCLVYEIPVPMVALEAVCYKLPNYQEELQKGIKLGLIEVSPEPDESKRVYRVSRILPHIILNIRLPEAPQVYSLSQKAHDKLHQLWGNNNNQSEQKWREIFRLKFANKENPERFRQGFSQMLAVQHNKEADKIFKSELRKVVNDLVENRLHTQLESYLKQKQWKEADEETAWIFYQVMVKENYRGWDDTLENLPCETLKEINRLWLQNSNGNFGISIQMEIYRSQGGTSEYDDDIWKNFSLRVGWIEGYKKVINNKGKYQYASMPALIYTRRFDKGWFRNMGWGRIKHLFSRAETCVT